MRKGGEYCFCLFYGFSLNMPLQAVDKIYASNLQHSPYGVAFSLNSHPSSTKDFFSNGVETSSGPRRPHYRRCMITLRHTTINKTSVGEWSDRRGNLYLTTHNNIKRETSMPPAGFEPAIPSGERPQTHAIGIR